MSIQNQNRPGAKAMSIGVIDYRHDSLKKIFTWIYRMDRIMKKTDILRTGIICTFLMLPPPAGEGWGGGMTCIHAGG
jgi:hypothetical protein